MSGASAKLTISLVLGGRFSTPVKLQNLQGKEAWSRTKVIQEVAKHFPDFDSLRFTEYSLNRYEDLHQAVLQHDRLKLLQILSLPYYEAVKASFNSKSPLCLYPKAVSGKITSGYVITGKDTDLQFAHVALEIRVKAADGGKHTQTAVMERRADPRVPDTWKIALIESID